MGFLKGIKPSTFLSTYDEWHVFVIGFCEVLCPWPPRHSINSTNSTNSINSEYHYYVFGRALGVIAWLIIAKNRPGGILVKLKDQSSKSKFVIWVLDLVCHLDFDIWISPKEGIWPNQDSDT